MERQDKTITTTNITTLSNPILYVPKIMFLTKGKGLHKDISDISDTITKYILTISMEKTVTSDVLIGSYFGEMVMEEKDGVWMAKESDSLDDE
jgi:hypothetical protein